MLKFKISVEPKEGAYNFDTISENPNDFFLDSEIDATSTLPFIYHFYPQDATKDDGFTIHNPTQLTPEDIFNLIFIGRNAKIVYENGHEMIINDKDNKHEF